MESFTLQQKDKTSKLPTIIFSMTDDLMEENSFIDEDGAPAFYKMVGERLGIKWENVTSIDCRKINVAPNVVQHWMDNIRTVCGESVDSASLCMQLCLNGPKQDDSLPKNCYSVEWGAYEPMPKMFAYMNHKEEEQMTLNKHAAYSEEDLVNAATEYIRENSEEIAEPILYFLSELTGISVDRLLEFCSAQA